MENQLTPRQRLQGLPMKMLVVAAALVVIGLVAAIPIGSMSDQDKANNALLTGVPFILCFIALVLAFIFLIITTRKLLNNNIPQRLHQVVEWIIVGGVVVGVVGMFQPWILGGYQFGFLLLIFCFITFNIWSHITPRQAQRAQKSEGVI